MSGPDPIVAASTMDPELSERIDRFNRDLARLHALEAEIETDRERNRRERSWWGWPWGAVLAIVIPTEAREIEALRLARELDLERATLGALCPIWGRLGGIPTKPTA